MHSPKQQKTTKNGQEKQKPNWITWNQEREKSGLTVNNRGLELFQNIEGKITWHMIMLQQGQTTALQ